MNGTLQDSCLAVLKPMSATKESFESSRRDLDVGNTLLLHTAPKFDLAHERRGPRVPVLQHAVEGHREELEGVRRVEGGVEDRLRVAALGPPTPGRLMRIKRRAFGPFR